MPQLQSLFLLGKNTTFLPNDLYPKVPGILRKLARYSELTLPLLDKKIRKTKKVFNDEKVTDHHAIIPTGIEAQLQGNMQKVYDIITRRFIAVFYDDSEVSNSTVLGKASDVVFKTTGKEILTRGWRVVFQNKNNEALKQVQGDKTLPSFVLMGAKAEIHVPCSSPYWGITPPSS